jgi:hypothetical protein
MDLLLHYKHTKFSISHKFPALPLEEQMARHRKEEKERIAPR